MNKLNKYIIKNSQISEYYKDYDDKENVIYFISYISLFFNNKYYNTFLIDINNNCHSYKNRLYYKIKNIIINDLGNQKINEINF